MRTILVMSLTFCSALMVVAVASSFLEIWATTRGAAISNTQLAQQEPPPLTILTSGLMVRSAPSRMSAK
jgi:hypothetical protein